LKISTDCFITKIVCGQFSHSSQSEMKLV